jgi:hypothetical protein
MIDTHTFILNRKRERNSKARLLNMNHSSVCDGNKSPKHPHGLSSPRNDKPTMKADRKKNEESNATVVTHLLNRRRHAAATSSQKEAPTMTLRSTTLPVCEIRRRSWVRLFHC